MTPEERLAVLDDILTDPVNQLEVTKGGYFIYRFDLETMHRIADALGVPSAQPIPFANCYTLQELTQFIK